MTTMDIFEFLYPKFVINKPIRLIETFAGIGAQAKALENLGVDFEHWKVIEFDKYPVASYNAIHGTNFKPTDIRDVHAADLDMRERERYCYILTYSFPCQDLSVAGRMRGMSKGNETRSGLLWEVERILDECGTELPHVLLMENVPQVIGERNIKDFIQWRDKLETLGYQNYVDVLNSKDYGVPQNRARCFMVSILGEYSYTFPKKIPLEKKLKDVLEEHVDKKYYLSEEKIRSLEKQSMREHKPTLLERERELTLSPPHTDTSGLWEQYVVDSGEYIQDGLCQKQCLPSEWYISDTDGKRLQRSGADSGRERERENGIAIPEKTKKGYRIANDGDGVYINRPNQKRGTVQKGMIQTIKTSPDIGVVVEDEEQ